MGRMVLFNCFASLTTFSFLLHSHLESLKEMSVWHTVMRLQVINFRVYFASFHGGKSFEECYRKYSSSKLRFVNQLMHARSPTKYSLFCLSFLFTVKAPWIPLALSSKKTLNLDCIHFVFSLPCLFLLLYDLFFLHGVKVVRLLSRLKRVELTELVQLEISTPWRFWTS